MKALLLARNQFGLGAAVALSARPRPCRALRCWHGCTLSRLTHHTPSASGKLLEDRKCAVQRLALQRNGFGELGMRWLAGALRQRADVGRGALREMPLWPQLQPREVCSDADLRLMQAGAGTSDEDVWPLDGWPLATATVGAVLSEQRRLFMDVVVGHL